MINNPLDLVAEGLDLLPQTLNSFMSVASTRSDQLDDGIKSLKSGLFGESGELTSVAVRLSGHSVSLAVRGCNVGVGARIYVTHH